MDLWYPSVIIPLLSPVGQEIFYSSSHLTYDRLNPNFEAQEQMGFCGIASACVLLKTLLPNQRWNQSTIYADIARHYMLNGITLANLSRVLEHCGLRSIIRYCHSDDENVEEQFRKDVNNTTHFLIVNYWRQFEEKDKNYVHKGGHFSLVAGFDQRTDHVLILDTSQKRFPHHWLSIKHLIRMMSTNDRMSSMPRGYLIVLDPNSINNQ